MHPITSTIRRFLELADVAIAAAEREQASAAKTGKTWLVEDCELALAKFRAIRDQAISGSLPTSNGGGLGIIRALSEWEVSDDLYVAGHALEAFYQDEYRELG